MLNFDSGYLSGGRLQTRTAREIENEPMLFRASLSFAMANGGEITREFLNHFDPKIDAVVDTRSHMLMRGHYPCIPGWHHDDVPRDTHNKQPNYDNPAYLSNHAMAVVDASDAPTGSLTEFVAGRVSVPWPLDEGATVYAVWDAHLGAMRPSIKAVASGEIAHFSSADFHRGVAASAAGWRFFIRLTYNTGIKPDNKIRKNANVYVPWSTAGW